MVRLSEKSHGGGYGLYGKRELSLNVIRGRRAKEMAGSKTKVASFKGTTAGFRETWQVRILPWCL